MVGGSYSIRPIPHQVWQYHNRAAIAQRLARLRYLPDGVIYDGDSGLQRIRILKTGSHLMLYFVDALSGTLEGPMSRIDLDRPLHLLAGYAQAALLTLIWRPTPQRICVLGFGGGRISMLLHHHLPAAIIDNVDIDPAFRTIAPAYFGIEFDDRQRLFIDDARHFLEAAANHTYDIVIMDAFRDDGDQLDHLATTQFYRHCAQRLAKGGVLCANMLRSDPHVAAKIKTLSAQFFAVHLVELKHALVVFGSAYRALRGAEILERAAGLQRRHEFDLPFVERAAELCVPRDIDHEIQQQLSHASVLTDQMIHS
jgi:spermidine synthase